MHGSLREEVQVLRKRVLELQNVSRETDILRKDLAQTQHDKAALEMEFMNDMSSLARAHSVKAEELEGRLAESANINRALSEQLRPNSPSGTDKKFRELEADHEQLLANILENSKVDMERLRDQVAELQSSKAELESEIAHTRSETQQEARQEHSNSARDTDGLRTELKESQAKVAQLNNQVKTMELDLSSTTFFSENEFREVEERLQLCQAALADKTSQLEKEQQTARRLEQENEQLQLVNQRLEMENRQSKQLEHQFEAENLSLAAAKQQLETWNQEIQASSQQGSRDAQKAKDNIEKENQEISLLRESLETDNRTLKESRQKLANENRGLKASRDALEKECQEMKEAVEILKNESPKSTLLRQKNFGRSGVVVAPIQNETPALNLEKESESTGEGQATRSASRASLMIQRLEANLKKDVQQAPNIPKFRKQKPVEVVPDYAALEQLDSLKAENQSLTKDLGDLRHILEQEKDTIDSLRRQVSELKSGSVKVQPPPFPLARNSPSPFSGSPHYRAMSPRTMSVTRATEENSDIVELTQRLIKERETTVKLRLEREVATTRRYRTVASPQESPLRPTAPPRGPQTPMSPVGARKLPGTIETGTLEVQNKVPRSPRTPVRDLVMTFQRRISQHSPTTENVEDSEFEVPVIRRSQSFHAPSSVAASSASHYAFDTDNVDDLKQALKFEREQVQELEQELTRQCQINCQLLKEISSLSTETEKSRVQEASQFEQKFASDQIELDRLSAENQFLKSQVSRQTDVSKSQSQRSNGISDQKEIDQLKQKIEQLKSQSVEADEAMRKFAEKNFSDQMEIGKLHSEVDRLNTRLTDTDEAMAQVSGYLKDKSLAYDTEIEQLRSQVAELEKKLAEVEKLAEEYVQKNLSDKVELRDLNSKMETLESDLSRVTESRDELDTQHREQQCQVDGLKTQVDEKVKEFERIHGHDSEEIARLRSQVEALQGELQNTLVSVDGLKAQVEEKEDVEVAVEEMSKLNQKSFYSQLNKLQTELTKAQIEKQGLENKIKELENIIESAHAKQGIGLEAHEKEVANLKRVVDKKEMSLGVLIKEKEQLVMSMQNMSHSRKDELEELQIELMEMSTKAAEQSRQVQQLKSHIDDSGFRQEEVERLRAQVRDLGEQFAEREDSHVHEKTDLEIECNNLRQKLHAVSLQRKTAEEKLSLVVADQAEQASSKSAQVLRERNAALKFEVEKLTRKLRKMAERKEQTETSLESARLTI
jgi:chromosome segregation ATPase